MIVIKNGSVLGVGQNAPQPADILVKDGLIEAIEKPGSFSKTQVERTIDAQGCWVTPGLIDIHVHLREPGYEWKETILAGSRAAVLGGFTSIACMANTNPVHDNAEVTRFILEKASAAGLARVYPIGAVSLGLEGKQMAPLSELRKAGCVAFSDDGEPVYDTVLMRRALEWAKMISATVCVHEEDKGLCCGGCINESELSLRLGLPGRPKVAEEVMVARDIELARTFKSRIHFCHISTARSVELIRRAKNDGIPVTAEVTPHHLVLTEAAIGDYDTNARVNPPLRNQEDCQALIEGLNDGSIDTIASDHAPHHRDSKDLEFIQATPGLIGLQSTLPIIAGLIEKGQLKMARAFEAMTVAPAQALAIRGGKLERSASADIAVIDPQAKWQYSPSSVASVSKNTPFLGQMFKGQSRWVLVGGKIVVDEGKLA